MTFAADSEGRLDAIEKLLTVLLALESPQKLEIVLQLITGLRSNDDSHPQLEILISQIIKSSLSIRNEVPYERLYYGSEPSSRINRNLSDSQKTIIGMYSDTIDKINQLHSQVSEAISHAQVLDNKVEDIRHGVDVVQSEFHNELARVQSNLADLSREFHKYLAIDAVKNGSQRSRLKRYLPVKLYISANDDRAYNRLEAAVKEELSRIGFEIRDEYPLKKGSRFKELIASTKDFLTSAGLKKKVKEVAKAWGIDAKKSEVAVNLSQSVKNLSDAMGDHEGYMLAGPVVVVKHKDQAGNLKVFSKVLTDEQLLAFECQEHDGQTPAQILQSLVKPSIVTGGTQTSKTNTNQVDFKTIEGNSKLLAGPESDLE